MQNDHYWDQELKPRKNWWQIDLSEIWHYRDLLMLLIRRDFVSVYKQTVLGPVWFVVQPVLTALTFSLIFGKIASIPTEGIPPFLFYFTGITAWTYFADCLTKTSNTFVANAGVFGKVYFPRLIVPLSLVIGNLIKFSIQFGVLVALWVFFYLSGAGITLDWQIGLLPLLLVIMAALGLGSGMIISSLTTKYRDLTFLIGFGVQLLMYAAPVVYPLSIVSPRFRSLVVMNPMTGIIETFKAGLLGEGTFSWGMIAYSGIFAGVVLVLGTVIFNKVERSFMDTV